MNTSWHSEPLTANVCKNPPVHHKTAVRLTEQNGVLFAGCLVAVAVVWLRRSEWASSALRLIP